jgi:hypothetical protein
MAQTGTNAAVDWLAAPAPTTTPDMIQQRQGKAKNKTKKRKKQTTKKQKRQQKTQQ